MPAAVAAFAAAYPFPLDEFQLTAATSVAEGRGVLVCAPTGAGKTVVGEFAVHEAIRREGTCFYTTPIKALSNQKYHDLVARYGEDRVGLLTGDVSINGDAPVVVMTTEVLRNMIYADSDRLDSLTHVVMDEVHFLADPSRGPVWEETILNLDPRVILVSLSATVSNAEEFGAWLSTVRGRTDLVVTTHRPVPLHQSMMVGSQILPLYGDGRNGRDADVNRAVVAACSRAEESGRRQGPKRADVVAQMRAASMLPAIYFIFSRAGCDGAVRQLLVDRVRLTTDAERDEILAAVDKGVEGIATEDLGVLGFRQWRRALGNGFGAHHAGMLPAFRHIVEDLFSRGLLKVCFATETLALGINMPARTVVLEKLIKFNGEAHVDLTPGQYTQLTGRAGRRGIDTEGNALVLWSKGIDPYAVANLAQTRTYPLDSTFRPGYNMAVNLISTKGYTDSHRLLDRSFAQYQAASTVVEQAERASRRRRDLSSLERDLSKALSSLKGTQVGVDDVIEYAGLRRDLTLEERRAKKDSATDRQAETARLLSSLSVGDIIALPTGRHPQIAAVARGDSDHRRPRPWIITEDGWCGPVTAETFGNVPVPLGHMSLHKGVQRSPKRNARAVASNLRKQKVDRPRVLKPKAKGGSRKAAELRDRVHVHPVHLLKEREDLVRPAERVVAARRTLERELEVTAPETESLSRTFDRILDLLGELDFIEQDAAAPSSDRTSTRITAEGRRLAQVHHESDLLVAQCLRRGVWDDLDPAELAAVVSTCVFENRRESEGRHEDGVPTEALADAVSAVFRIHGELVSDEARHRLPLTRDPDLGFATAVHQWAAGAPLDYCLRAAEASGATLSAGDFVRWCNRVVDLLEQIRHTGYSDSVKASARKAVPAIRRGVVELGA
ncbi:MULTISPECIES: DEAD/DEAH box helicase [unclassified Corynebacterium]|uniref:DEAD/DEAH box helicase n=1 Tax=unclassified Corynebacterium TaxID=2624378 RepID=UPI0026494E32|nr:DEAD/DEAH box helicase [Corynebacterium sp.]MDN5580942.1 DEAD/DEAH box helicase [Corynebacterium sp.]MDN5719253.1 DEAD/DEAH box helicase [Corynebacterium sp.]MDN6386133.1 DEAD/DEAH box helicase [Corynebacterium sp.]